MSDDPLVIDDVLRFAVGAPDGPRSSVWRMGLKSTDIYWAPRNIFHLRKGSVHYPRPPDKPTTFRYVGGTAEYAKSKGCPTSVKDRALAIWPGREIVNNYFIEFSIRIARSELRQFVPGNDPEQLHWITAPPVGMASQVLVLSGPPSHVGPIPVSRGTEPQELIGDFQLENGRYVWVIHHYIPAPEEHLRAARAQMEAETLLMLAADPTLELIPTAATRLLATTDCHDGTFSEDEYAGDFLPLRRIA